MLQTATKTFQSLDRTPYTLQLTYHGRQHFKSRTGSTMSLLYYLAVIAIFLVTLISEYWYLLRNENHRQSLIWNMDQVKNHFCGIDLNRSWLNDSYYEDYTKIGILITVQDQNGTDIYNLTAENISDANLGVYVQQTYLTNGTVTNIQPAISCHEYFSENTPNKTTNQIQFENYFCFPKGFNVNLAGRSDIFVHGEKWPYHRLGIFINKTNASKDVSIRFAVRLKFICIVTAVNESQFVRGHKDRIFYIKDGWPISENQSHQLTLYFRQLQVHTDRNLLFSKSVPPQNYVHFNEQFTQLSMTNNSVIPHNRIVWIKFKRSISTVEYQRYCKKLPAIMGEIFGMVGFAGLVMLVVAGYNRWKFEREYLVEGREGGEGVDGGDRGSGKGKGRINILWYYWEKIRGLFCCKCCKNNEADITSSIYTDFQNQLDIYRLNNKLRSLQQKISLLQSGITQSISPNAQVSGLNQSGYNHEHGYHSQKPAKYSSRNKNYEQLQEKLIKK